MIREFVLSVVLSASPFGAAGDSLINSVVAGRKCTTSATDDTQLNCKFRVDTAEFEIAGVSADDAQLAVYAADVKSTWVSFGLGHQCVMVKNGKAIAFVSPRNAKVYGDWRNCASASNQGR